MLGRVRERHCGNSRIGEVRRTISMQRQSRIERLFDEIIVDACGYDEQLWAFQAVLDEDITCPVDAFVLGEPVEVAKVDYDGNERRGITATCRKNKTEWVVSVADVVFAAGSPAADLVDAYRKLLGLKPVGGTRAGEKMHKAEVAEIAIGEAVDVAILAAKGHAMDRQPALSALPSRSRALPVASRPHRRGPVGVRSHALAEPERRSGSPVSARRP
jgi:hypothetical protein